MRHSLIDTHDDRGAAVQTCFDHPEANTVLQVEDSFESFDCFDLFSGCLPIAPLARRIVGGQVHRFASDPISAVRCFKLIG
jgi:galactose mutarotase-like enzyme